MVTHKRHRQRWEDSTEQRVGQGEQWRDQQAAPRKGTSISSVQGAEDAQHDRMVQSARKLCRECREHAESTHGLQL
jgi:hypothetical protein